MNGYMGKILRINLSDRKTSTIDTAAYEQWGGGHGMGSAIFFDLVKDKTIDGFDPANVVTIMTSPLTGTIAPGATARTEMQGIGVQSSPIGWFTRSNFGGRFGAMMKYAGWDGIVIEGAADRPVWVDIRNDAVQIKDASSLWGLDTWKTQDAVWKEVNGSTDFKGWFEAGGDGSWKRSTQRPAVLCIGQAGEKKGRIASVVHDAGNAAGQGGFGGVWGSKNLKAISVIGTGSVAIADPRGLLDARMWVMKKYATQVDNISSGSIVNRFQKGWFASYPMPVDIFQYPQQSRPQGCMGCHAGCRLRLPNASGNESKCIAFDAYQYYDLFKHSSAELKREAIITGNYWLIAKYGTQTSASYRAPDLMQQYGINAAELWRGIKYLTSLAQLGILGPGKSIDSDLPFESLGDEEFIEVLTRMIALREGVGDDMAEGFYRAAERWGRLEQDLASGILMFPHWGLPEHMPIPGQTEWGFSSILSDRDVNEHDFNMLNSLPSRYLSRGEQPPIDAEELATIFAEKLFPYEGNTAMLDFSTENIYSENSAKLVAWYRHYTRFWKQSVLYCDFLFPDFYNGNTPDYRGFVGEGEQKFYNAVTGQGVTFEDGMERGRKIWNLDNALWTMQGRHRDMVKFADYIYTNPLESVAGIYRPGKENGQWKYIRVDGRSIDREKFETFKTNFYGVEGWDAQTGWPTRSTLEGLDLGYVADELETYGRLRT